MLRSWLLYFVTVVHGYFMSCVLATTELELRDQLMRAKDLDKLIEVHQNYINRIYDRQVLRPYLKNFKEPRNLFQGINSASKCSLASRYDNPIPTRPPIDCSKIPALFPPPFIPFDVVFLTIPFC